MILSRLMMKIVMNLMLLLENSSNIKVIMINTMHLQLQIGLKILTKNIQYWDVLFTIFRLQKIKDGEVFFQLVQLIIQYRKYILFTIVVIFEIIIIVEIEFGSKIIVILQLYNIYNNIKYYIFIIYIILSINLN